jgi:hypothetical protein
MDPSEVKLGHFYRALVRKGLFRQNKTNWPYTSIVRIEAELLTGGWIATDIGMRESVSILSAQMLVEEVPVQEYLRRPDVVMHEYREHLRRSMQEETPGIPVRVLRIVAVLLGLSLFCVALYWAIVNDRIIW